MTISDFYRRKSSNLKAYQLHQHPNDPFDWWTSAIGGILVVLGVLEFVQPMTHQ
jgi:uncharacterized membrane protein HdeD (DUF308 family)